MPRRRQSAVLSVRVSPELDARLGAIARRRRQSRSETARRILEASLTGTDPDPQREARRQSRLASKQASEADTLGFIVAAADLRGWR